MPSASEKQKRFMRAAAHDATFAERNMIPQSVAREFVAADQAQSKKRRSKKEKK